MPLTYAQLTQPLSVGQIQTLLLNALQGIGIISQTGATAGSVGAGTGSVSYASGTPNASYSVVIRIVTSGEPGVGQFQFATDGVTFGSSVTIPSGTGQYVLGSTGVTVTFTAGPAGGGTSFISGDLYSFSLSAPNFPVTSWSSGSAYRTLVNIEAQVLGNMSQLIASMGAGGLAASATQSWADLLGVNVYNLTRNPAVATVGSITLTDANNVGPFAVPAGAMYVQGTTGLRYINQVSFTIPKGGSVSTPFQAEAPGAAYNAAVGTITTIAVNTLPGVTVTNPNPGNGIWWTASGVDAESDAAYMSRCLARWPALGPGAVASTYDLWARTASANITRTIVVVDPTVAGQVDIYCAGTSGASASADVTLANTYIQARTPLTAQAIVAAASNVNVKVQMTVTYRAAVASLASVQAAINTGLTSFFNTALMGKDAAGSVKLYLDQLRDVVMNVSGVVNCDPVAFPAGDTALTTGQCAVLDPASNVGTTWSGWTFTAV